MLLSALQ